MYDKLGLKHEPLTLIQPTFETPLPPLQPAVSATMYISYLSIAKQIVYI